MQYQGSCHCQAVNVSVDFTLQQPITCNCSYCYKRQAPVHIVDELKVNTGIEALSCYRFNSERGEHYFCKHCGIFIYGPTPSLKSHTINLAILDDCDWESLPLHHFDGKSL